MYSDFIDYGWNNDYIHRVYDDHDKGSSKVVVIST